MRLPWIGKGKEQPFLPGLTRVEKPKPSQALGTPSAQMADLGRATTAGLVLICSSWKGVPASKTTVSQDMNPVTAMRTQPFSSKPLDSRSAKCLT